jgi:hypothetical protein
MRHSKHHAHSCAAICLERLACGAFQASCAATRTAPAAVGARRAHARSPLRPCHGPRRHRARRPASLTPRRPRARSKFRDGHWPDVQAELRGERARLGPGASVYCLSIKYDAPGVFYLAAILPTAAGTPRREYFTASPAGFYFRKRARAAAAAALPCPDLCALCARAARNACVRRERDAAPAPRHACRGARRRRAAGHGRAAGPRRSCPAGAWMLSRACHRRGSERACQRVKHWMADLAVPRASARAG